jgi:hypothetical protein
MIWLLYGVPGSGLFFRELTDYPNISQITKKSIPYIYSTLVNNDVPGC